MVDLLVDGGGAGAATLGFGLVLHGVEDAFNALAAGDGREAEADVVAGGVKTFQLVIGPFWARVPTAPWAHGHPSLGQRPRNELRKQLRAEGPPYRHAPIVESCHRLRYACFSVGPSDLEALRRYIDHQNEHHRTRTFQEEFRAFLGKYNVDYDEAYVWD